MPAKFASVCIAVIASLATTLQGDVTVTIDPAVEYQTILGWGAVSWMPAWLTPAMRDEIIRECVNELGLNRLRLEPPFGNYNNWRRWEWDNDNGDPDEINWSALNTADLDWRMTEMVIPFKQYVEANGEPFVIYVSPSFFDRGGSGSVPAWLLHSPGEYAEFATSILLYLQNTYALAADYYCILNEAGNANPFTADVVGTMIKTLGPKLATLGLPTTIEFPESISASVSWSYIQALQNDPDVWPYIGVLTYHLYGTNDPYRSYIRDFAVSRGLPTGQTEYMGSALTVDHLYDDLTLGGVSYWEIYGIGSQFAWNYSRLQRKNQYWNLRQVLHYVRPGAVRIEASPDGPSLRALAFMKDDRATVVLINGSGQQNATVTNLPNDTYGVCYNVGNGPYAELGLRSVVNGTLAVSIPAGAVMTIYPYAGTNQPPTPTDWKASPEFLTMPADSVTLSAMATDPELDPISYSWSILSQPGGANVNLSTPDAASTAATGLSVAGDYLFIVAVSDDASNVVTREVRVTVFAGNQPPTGLSLSNRRPVVVTLPESSTWLRAGAWDLEGDPLSYQWRVVSQPDGADVSLSTPNQSDCWANNITVAGDYLFELQVSDPTHTVSQLLTVIVYPQNTAPVISDATASPANITLPLKSTNLSATTSDPDGDTITHWWSVKSAPGSARPVFASPGSANTVVSGLSRPGAYVFTLTVIDRTKVTTADVTVTVVEGLAGDVDGDGDVDVFDVIAVVNAFGSVPGDPDWDERCDLDGNDIVDVFDVMVVVYNFGATQQSRSPRPHV